MEFLTGNPFCTPVGQRIEYATSLQSEDWGLNMEICDIICETEDGPKDAVRAIKKRIVGNKNFKEVMLALTVLEACVKNCGYRFHVLVSAREFVEGVLVRTILPRNDPPLVVHDRILTIIQAWADAFRSSPDLTGVVCVYEDLRRKGVMFPVAELCSPIHTPNKRFFPATGHEDPLSPTQQAQTQQQTFPFQNTEGPITLSPDEVKKLTSNLETVHGNLKVMSKIMSPIDPARSQQSHTELLKGLYSMCKEMQDQIVHLIPRVTDEKLVEQLLVANDDMNTTFTQYHRLGTARRTLLLNYNCKVIDMSESNKTYLMQNENHTREKRFQAGVFAEDSNQAFIVILSTKCHISSFEKRLNRQNSVQSGANLIDLEAPCKPQSQSQLEIPVSQTVSSLSSHMARLSTKEKDVIQRNNYSSGSLQDGASQESSVLDELAAASSQVQNARGDDSSDSALLGSSPQLYWMVEKGMIPVNQSDVMDNIEQWLDVDDDDDLIDEGVTSEEFDRFLAGRAKAAERLPSVKPSRNDHTPSQP